METLHYLLMKAHSTLNRRIMAGAAAFGLSPGQPKVLEYLLACGQANQKAIAEYCEIEPATVGAILQRMEAAGLVRRANRQGDRRAVYVSLTSAGEQAARRMEAVFASGEEEAARQLTGGEREQLCALLERLCAAAKGGEQA